MFPKHDFFPPASEAQDLAAMREELRGIARELRSLSAGSAPRTPDLLADQIRAQIERIQLPRAA
ncbi:hypothetical protein SPAN111604_01530 [Sphingomonas antarctica]|uniref:hypothetical protein n=1 Tax=Sphingomonas antarctica TaxID=2040274 RepID=UPI0039E91B00